MTTNTVVNQCFSFFQLEICIDILVERESIKCAVFVHFHILIK